MIHALVVVGKNIKNVVDKRFCVQFRSFFFTEPTGWSKRQENRGFSKKICIGTANDKAAPQAPDAFAGRSSSPSLDAPQALP